MNPSRIVLTSNLGSIVINNVKPNDYKPTEKDLSNELERIKREYPKAKVKQVTKLENGNYAIDLDYDY